MYLIDVHLAAFHGLTDVADAFSVCPVDVLYGAPFAEVVDVLAVEVLLNVVEIYQLDHPLHVFGQAVLHLTDEAHQRTRSHILITQDELRYDWLEVVLFFDG